MTLGMAKFPPRVPAWVIPALGYAVSIASLAWILHGVDGSQIIEDLQSLRWKWVILAVLGDIGAYIWQAYRWNLLLSPVVRVPLWRSIQAIYVGLFANEVLPLRPGEVIRSYLQARWTEVPFSVAFSSVIIERIFDGLWLVTIFALTTAFITLPPFMVDMARFVAAVVIVMSILLGVVMFRKHHAHAACSATRWGTKLRVLVEDLHLMGNSKSFYAAAAASLPYLLLQVIPIYALMRAYELDLTIWPALVVLVIFRVGTTIPQAPGNVGASQALMVLSLSLFGIDKTTATGYSVMTWGVITLPLLIAGFLALAITGLRLGDLRHHARTHMAAAPVPATEPQQ